MIKLGNYSRLLEITITQTSEEEPTLLEVHHSEKEVNTSISKETLAVTISIHENFLASTSTDQEFQCYHRSTDPLPVVTIHEECIDEPLPKKRKLSEIDIEGIIMGKELSDADINLAQRLLKAQFPELGGLQSSLLQQKKIPIPEKKEKMLQIVHCPSHHHWIVATTIGNKGDAGKVLVYDSIFNNVDKETRKIICTIFQQLPVSNVKLRRHKNKWVQKTVACLP